MTAARISCARTSKSRGRPLGATAQSIRDHVLDDLVGRYDRMTVRQVYYALEVAGVVEKTEGGYRQVQRQLLIMREKEMLPWSFIADGTRWQRKPDTWRSSGAYVQAMARNYRRDLWQSQGVRIEVWLEKDALADVVTAVTDAWDVSLMVSRGQSSATYIYSAAQAARHAFEDFECETFIYLLYDFDAGGERAARTIARELPIKAEVPVHTERLAVTAEQIMAWQLPTRLAKKSDPEAKKHGPIAVELDAIPPDRLTGLVADAITQHVDQGQWEIEQTIEREEREGLLELARRAA
jgi:hypothetical protein